MGTMHHWLQPAATSCGGQAHLTHTHSLSEQPRARRPGQGAPTETQAPLAASWQANLTLGDLLLASDEPGHVRELEPPPGLLLGPRPPEAPRLLILASGGPRRRPRASRVGRLLPAGLAHSKLAWVGWCAQARWPDVCPRCCDKLCGPEGQGGVFPRPGTGSSRALRGHSRHPTPACEGFARGSRVLHLVAPGPILQRSRPVDAGAGPTRGLASLCRGRSLLPVLGRGRADQLPVRLHCPRHLPDQGPLRAAAGSPRCVWECGLRGRGRGGPLMGQPGCPWGGIGRRAPEGTAHAVLAFPPRGHSSWDPQDRKSIV